jgi:hypothetical protein
MDDLARMNFLFGCDTHERKVKFQLEFEFNPELRLDYPVKLSARGRDTL